MNNKQATLSIVAGLLFVCGLTLMLFVTPTVRQDTPPVVTTQPVTEPETTVAPATEPPTEPPTEPVTYPPAETTPPAELSLTADNAFVYNCAEDRLLYVGGDPEQKLAPASLTKLLTAYVALECLEPEQIVTVGEEITWIDPMSSIAGLSVGNRLSVDMLVQGLIMQSGNDAAYTLAVAGGRALAEDDGLDRRQACGLFMDEVNRHARLLGLKNTHFMNPDGIDEEGHYTTVNDLITLTKTVMDCAPVMKYGAVASEYVIFESGEDYVWRNSNYLLHEESAYYTPEATGLKTGSTSGAGKCLISLFQTEDGILMVGVLGSDTDESRYTDTLALYNRYK